MYLVDANVLVYASNENCEEYVAASSWLDQALNGPARSVGLPWQNLLSYLRLTTNHRIFDPPAPPAASWGAIEAWLALPSVWIPQPGPHFATFFGEVVDLVAPRGNFVMDAYLAALAKEHKLTVVTSDKGFERFAEVDLVELINPGAVRLHGFSQPLFS